MYRPGGYLIGQGPEGIVEECDSYTCAHCGKVSLVRPKQRAADMGGLCKTCMGLICPACLDQGCLPLEKRLAEQEARYHALRSYGLA